ncbi:MULTISPECIES: SLATT domain-containing protein [unclassified Pseudomonas]|uniref:SLATT domain-containing protein n=1 Tax=unclassified Pseudomonas TaxID=196821 RepID=UPI00081C1CD0|nr:MULTISPECIES: SLATT domain-containing protein [unclassified Pseudomonas]
MVKNMCSTAEDYRHYAQKKSNAHYRMSEKAKAKHNTLGIPVAVSTTVVGTTIFTTLNSTSQNLYVQIAIGLLSLSAAVLAALQTFFNFGDIATQHKQAAASYEAVRHKLDIFLLSHGALHEDLSLDAPLKELRVIAAELDEIAKKAPSVPDSVYDSAKTRVAERPILRP